MQDKKMSKITYIYGNAPVQMALNNNKRIIKNLFVTSENSIFNKNVRINPLLNTKKKLIYNILLVFHKKFKKIKKQKNLLDFTF